LLLLLLPLLLLLLHLLLLLLLLLPWGCGAMNDLEGMDVILKMKKN